MSEISITTAAPGMLSSWFALEYHPRAKFYYNKVERGWNSVKPNSTPSFTPSI